MRITATDKFYLEPIEMNTHFSVCSCGCGGLTKPHAYTGMPQKFILGHARKRQIDSLYQIDNVTGCWNWLGTLDMRGYGIYSNFKAHRLVYEKYKGTIPNALHLDHLCRNKSCVNPSHLEPVTQKVNNRRCPTTKLRRKQLLEIKEKRAKGVTYYALGREYGVHWVTIWKGSKKSMGEILQCE